MVPTTSTGDAGLSSIKVLQCHQGLLAMLTLSALLAILKPCALLPTLRIFAYVLACGPVQLVFLAFTPKAV